ncbi:MAG: hypothetical protein M1821_008685 [Bathelium mastoideum]|nr:MAG: hypothetical protein M1821_008685 [Bathelium mastoideum]
MSFPFQLTDGDVASLIFIVFLVLFASFRLSANHRKGLKQIPGPRGIPFVGPVHELDINKPWFKLKEWSDEYGGLFQMKIMGVNHLWIGDATIGHELLGKRASIYSSRPRTPAIPGSDDGFMYLPLLATGDPWRRQRKFTHVVLSAAHKQQFHGYVQLEAKRFLWKLFCKPDQHYWLVEEMTSRTSNWMAYGTPKRCHEFIENVNEFIPQISPSGPVANLMPFLSYLPEWLNPGARKVRERMEREWIMFRHAFAEAEHDLDRGKEVPPCYVKSYRDMMPVASTLLEKASTMAQTESVLKSADGFGFPPDKVELTYAIGMLCNVAIMTIAGPLHTFFLALILHPEWQTQLQAEVDEVLGDRLAVLSDSASLPKLRAFIKECFRWRPPIPLGVPRLCTEDDVYNGYFIPKGTNCHVLELAISRDPRLYPDPETFNPSRWLDPAFPTFKEPLSEHPKLDGHSQFGEGWRKCLGIGLTEATLLLACSGVVWAFDCRQKRDASGKLVPVDVDARKPTVIGGPLPFELDMKPRTTARAQQIQRIWMDVQHEFEDES